jgi:antitoxin MazE
MYLHGYTGSIMANRTSGPKGLVVARWGNSLAVRLPVESAKRIGVEEGDTLRAEIAADGRLILTPEGRALAKADLRRMREFVERQKDTAPVVADMRRRARY